MPYGWDLPCQDNFWHPTSSKSYKRTTTLPNFSSKHYLHYDHHHTDLTPTKCNIPAAFTSFQFISAQKNASNNWCIQCMIYTFNNTSDRMFSPQPSFICAARLPKQLFLCDLKTLHQRGSLKWKERSPELPLQHIHSVIHRVQPDRWVSLVSFCHLYKLMVLHWMAEPVFPMNKLFEKKRGGYWSFVPF